MSSPQNSITVDHPGHVDQLGRVLFARHLFSVITRVEAEPSGAVVGLEGQWGSGKTRVLRSLEALSEEQPDSERVVLVKFNPWMVSGTHGLVEALLLQIAAQLPQPNEPTRRWYALKRTDSSAGAKLIGSIIQYTRVLSAVKHFAPIANLLWPGSGIAVAALGEATTEAASAVDQLKEPLAQMMRRPKSLSLTATKQNVDEALRSFGRRVIVIVDDIDRLAPTELAAMVQAIKAVADFPNVVYLLAYDPEIAAKAIEASLQVDDGRAYLEKIVQVPIELPPPPARRLQQFAISRIQSVLREDAVDAAEREDLRKAWPIIAAMLESPRDIERLRTKLQVVLPLMLGHLNAADLVILEALSLAAPDVVKWIDAHPKSLMKAGLRGLDESLNATGALGDQWADIWLDRSEKEKKAKERPIKLEELVSEKPRLLVPVREAVHFVFDKARGWERPREERIGSKRVQEYRFWYRWRCLHDSQERWASSEIAALLVEPEKIRSSGLLSSEAVFIEFCQEVCDLGTHNIASANAKEFSAVFVDAERLYHVATRYSQDEAFGYGPINALQTVLRIDSPLNRQVAIETLIDSGSVWLAGSIVHAAWSDSTPDSSIPVSQRLASDTAGLRSLVDRFLVRLQSQLSDPMSFEAADGYGPNTLLNWAAIVGADAGQLSKLATTFVGGDPRRLRDFFSAEVDSPQWEAFPMQIKWIQPRELKEFRSLAHTTPALFVDYTRLCQTLDALEQRLEQR